MEDRPLRSPSSSNTAEKDGPGSQKQAACLNCRKSKTRCLRNAAEDIRCKKCAQTGAECIVPDYRVGRKKGIKNKRDGLEKAVYRIEQAIKRSRTQGPDEEQNTQHLQALLTEAQGLLPASTSQTLDLSPRTDQSQGHQRDQNMSPPQPSQGHAHGLPNMSPGQRSLQSAHHITGSLNGSQALRSGIPNNSFRGSATETESPDDNFSVHDAENPLQLLARASDLSAPNKQTSYLSPPRFPGAVGDQQLRDFFGPFRPSLDVGEDIDPIELGLVTEEEASILFAYFHDNLAHTRWGLDPLLHTPQFVRKQSAFLFTSIMAASALFMPTASAVSRRLSAHCKLLARELMTKRNRSPEIVLGFMVNIPWMAPGEHWSDDGTCAYMASALTIAMDISLNKLIVPSPSDSLTGIHEGKPPSDWITAKKALELDGFSDVDPNSDFGKRLLRRRERIWLALFVLDRGVCLARGRSFTVPVTTIIERCDNWHKSAIADTWDGSIISSTVLRRDLATLISEVKKTCDSQIVSGNSIAQSLQGMIDGFFNNWYATWAFAIGGMKDNSIPPYVEILVTHGRLSIYSSVINHPTAPVEVKSFLRAAGLSSALNVLRAAVQGENRLKSMPNNTSIMISFAACFAFYLSTTGSMGSMSLAPSIRRLIEESADVLERLGSNPPHRNGTAALYGRHLREVIGTSVPGSEYGQSQVQATYPVPQNVQQPMQAYQNQPNIPQLEMSELLNFSSMSDDQINEAINNAGKELDMYIPNLQMEDQGALDWLDWFNMDINVNG
ncbi:hypothetical protein ONS95_009646 [Cadophora gregata]|uniref:uncharacterized protein n=1 Tax=Cadophora gregata TaxID=51156 RepID=UPI0026DB0278|nr:uncharacterized protein ONS95_009646 [Cadophora gregata]KAK0124703.1 hypothetical protein ONS95_009646 [Cadophora gregata]KAK0129437.1 hypothetical protein ONS96_000010 [Cadophora gregata f. sp. sojae]